MILTYLLVVVGGYLLGCFSTGLLVAGRRHVDIRSLGSKSTGATNVTRVMGIRSGLITFIGDMAKAALAVRLGTWLAGRDGAMLAGLAVVVGHNWPVFHNFRGGKGVACSLAVLVLIFPIETLIGGAVALAAIAITRYVSLGSLLLISVTTVAILFRQPFWPAGCWALVLTALGVIRHRSNIQRLVEGRENRFTPTAEDKNVP
ncbi:MAG: glycerol-3-phosphate acyltransferase [Clostridiales bacterium]|nr:glycerol-3-phosphate acyltransferase [Clostridiales bacterium]